MRTTDHEAGHEAGHEPGHEAGHDAGSPGAPAGQADRSPLRLAPSGLLAACLGLLAGVAVLLAGLPADVALFGASLADLTLPAALLLALGGLWAGGWLSSPRPRWRVVDIVVASVLGVAGGFLFVVWNVGWEPLSRLLTFFPPASALLVGVWLLPGVLGGLVLRRPGAAVYTELVAATVSALVGNQWGFATVWYGLLEGLGAEFVLALLLYRRWGLGAALGAGAGAGIVVGLLDAVVYYPEFAAAWKLAYVGFAVLSGIVLAGLGAWALTRALARTGALAPLASGRDAQRV